MKKKVLIAVFSLALFATPMSINSVRAGSPDDEPKKEQKADCKKEKKEDCTKEQKKDCEKKCSSKS